MPDIETSEKISTMFMFEGDAESAMEFYTTLFDDSEITSVNRYGPDDQGDEGTVEQATFTLAGTSFRAIDSNVEHDFSFTPAVSLFVECDSEAELDDLFETLSDGGEVLMPLDSYPFAEKFAWVADEYGVSWQLNFD